MTKSRNSDGMPKLLEKSEKKFIQNFGGETSSITAI
jgi:hypothetical protein